MIDLSIFVVPLMAIAGFLGFSFFAFNQAIVIDPIGVPQDLAERGYTKDVVAGSLGDRMREIGRAAALFKSEVFTPPNESYQSVESLSEALQLTNYVHSFRELVGLVPLTIRGEIVHDGPDVLALEVHGVKSDGSGFHIRNSRPGAEIEQLLADAALNVYEHADPFVAVLYHYGREVAPTGAATRLDDSTDPLAVALYRYRSDLPPVPFTKTLEALARAFESTPPEQWAPLYTLWARLLSQQGKYDEGVAMADRAIRSNGRFGRAYCQRARIEAYRGQFAAALDWSKLAAEAEPTLGAAHRLWGDLLWRMGKRAEAIAQYQQAIADDPSYADAYQSYAIALYLAGRPHDAVALLQHAVQLAPLDPTIATSLRLALQDFRPPVSQQPAAQ